MELAAQKEEILIILAKYTEIPDKVKLRQLSHLMYEDKPKDETEAKFRSLLGSVPIALVNIFHTYMGVFFDCPPPPAFQYQNESRVARITIFMEQ